MISRCLFPSLLLATAVAAALPSDCLALAQNHDGRLYSFYAAPMPPVSGSGPMKVRIMVGGRSYFGRATAEVRILVPSQLKVLSGDLVRTGPIDDVTREPWWLELQPQRAGRYVVRGVLRINAPKHSDESEWEMPIQVARDTIYGATSDRVRDQRIEGGQRYRYAGMYGRIPIDGPERVDQSDLFPDRGGRRAEVLREVAGRCADCGLSEPESVVFTVMVNRFGRLQSAEWHEYWKYPQPSAAVVAAARATLDGWRFRAARARGRSTADAIGVLVVVFPGAARH